MAEENDLYASEVEKFRKYSCQIHRMVFRNNPNFREHLKTHLDGLNALEYSLKIASEESVSHLLVQCCNIVDPNNEELLVKFCQLITNSVSRQHIILEHKVETVTEYVLAALHQAGPHLQAEILGALSALLYENGGRLNKFHESLVGNQGILLCLSESGDEEVQRLALQCVENLCIRTPGMVYLDEHIHQSCFVTLLKLLHSARPSRMDELLHCRMLVSALRGIQNILLATKSLHTDHLGPLLAAIKVFSIHGLAGHICVVPDTLYPLPMSQYDPNPPSVTKSVAPSRETTGEGEAQKTNTPKGPGKKGKRKKPPRSKGRESDLSSAEDGTDALGLSPSLSGVEIPSLFPQWSRVSSSESEFSDTEGGAVSRLRSYCTKVRQCALACFHAVIKSTERRVMFGYWTSFLPDTPGVGGVPHGQTLFTTIMKDPSPKVRTGALAVLTALLEGSKQYLMAAEDSDAQRATFTPFSATLGFIAKELHRCLLLSLVAENSPLAITQIIKCLAALVPNIPYQRLRPGLLTRIVKQIKPFLNHRDPNIRVACLTCLGSIVSVQAPLLEVYHVLQAGRGVAQRTSSSSSSSTLSTVPANSHPQINNNQPTEITNQESGYHSNHSDVGGGNTPEAATLSPGVVTPGGVSGTQTPTAASLVDVPVTGEARWVVRLCVRNVSPELLDADHDQPNRRRSEPTHPLPVRLESLQLLAQLSKGYFPLVRPCLNLVRDLIRRCLEDKDPSVQLHGAKLLEEVGSVMLNNLQDSSGTTPSLEISQVQSVWTCLLTGPLPGVLQNSSHQAVRATACDCLANLGPQVFSQLSMDKRILCITLLLGLTSDEDHHVRAAAIRALGVYVLYPCLRQDVSFVADVANAILTSLDENNLSVKIKAAWALGNLSDALVLNKDSLDQEFMEDFSDMLLLKLFEMATRGSQDSDKVKSNAVRALGNLLRYLPPRSFKNNWFNHSLELGIQALVKNISSGTMKVRWNACYATANMFKNQLLPIGEAEWSIQVYQSLSAVVRDCKNFKVRINAAMAFSVPCLRKQFGDVLLFKSIVDSLVSGLEAAETVSDFAEYRYRDSLTEQVCGTLIHLLGLTEVSDLTALYEVTGSRGEMVTSYLQRYRQLLKDKQVPTHQERVESWKTTSSHLCGLKSDSLSPAEQTAISALLNVFLFSIRDSDHPSPGTEASPQPAFRQTYD